MVKRNTLLAARTLAAIVAAMLILVAPALQALGSHEGVPVSAESLELPGMPSAAAATLLAAEDRIVVVYADLLTTSLQLFELPSGGPLPGKAPAPAFVDKIDITPPLSPSFGLHAAAADAGAISVLYLDREREDKLLLKQVTRRPGSKDWALQLVEPSGAPVAVCAAGPADFIPFWAAEGKLLANGPLGSVVVRAGFEPAGEPAAIPGAPGFVSGDRVSGKTFLVSLVGSSPTVAEVYPRGAPGAAALAAGGTVGIAVRDAPRRRILLLEGTPAVGFRQTTVTPCDGEGSVFLAWLPTGWLFAFDEARPVPGRRWVYQVSVLVPEGHGRPEAVRSPAPGGGAAMDGQATPQDRTDSRPTYRKLIASSGPAPVGLLKAAVSGGSLYVLEIRDKARLLRVRLP